MTLKLLGGEYRSHVSQDAPAPSQIERLDYMVGMIDSLRDLASQSGYTTLERMLELVALQAMDERLRLQQTPRPVRSS